MRIGLLRAWLAGRYLPFWEPYLRELGQELVYPGAVAPRNLPLLPPVALVVAEIFSLKEQKVDYILLPDVQLGVEPDTSAGLSPWLADLGTALARLIPGLPALLRVPAEVSLQSVGFAAEVGQILTHNPMLARRALDRTRTLLDFRWPKPPTPRGDTWLGLVGQPYVLADPQFTAQLEEAAWNRGFGLALPQLSPPQLRREGEQLLPGLKLPSDLEVAGQIRSLSRLGRVRGLWVVADDEVAPLPGPLRRHLKRSTTPLAYLSDPAQIDESLTLLLSQLPSP